MRVLFRRVSLKRSVALLTQQRASDEQHLLSQTITSEAVAAEWWCLTRCSWIRCSWIRWWLSSSFRQQGRWTLRIKHNCCQVIKLIWLAQLKETLWAIHLGDRNNKQNTNSNYKCIQVLTGFSIIMRSTNITKLTRQPIIIRDSSN